MAVSGTIRDLVSLVLGEASKLAAGGVLLGVVAALAAGRGLKSLLYGIAPHDPLTFLTLPLLLAAIAVAAAAAPAWRAGRVDPMTALRDE